MSSSLTQNPMNKWRLDLSGNFRSTLTKSSDSAVNPPGYIAGFVAQQKVDGGAVHNEQQNQHLLGKRAWDLALQPMKSLPMNMFMMYMAGNTISIFPIMMVVMMAWRPIKALMAVNMAFKSFEGEYNGSLLGHKLIFILGNLSAMVLAVYKCHSMGLLPNHASDWLDFMIPPKRLQYALYSN